jgi:hypothetical protein
VEGGLLTLASPAPQGGESDVSDEETITPFLTGTVTGLTQLMYHGDRHIGVVSSAMFGMHSLRAKFPDQCALCRKVRAGVVEARVNRATFIYKALK